MTKYFFILAMFLGMTLQAQNLRFNPKVGAGFYDFNVSKGTNVDPKIMVTLGCDVRIGSGNLFFNTGLHYSADAFNKDANTFSEKGSINFLRVPVGVGYYITGRDGILSLHLKGVFEKKLFQSTSCLISQAFLIHKKKEYISLNIFHYFCNSF